MSGVKWTKGPWIFHAHNGSITDSSAAQNEIADVLTEDWHQLGMGYANANLIAASPDLYNALSVLADAAEARGIPVDAARASMAKARGEQP